LGGWKRTKKPPLIDPASAANLRRELEKIPPQTNPRAAKGLADLRAAVKRLEEGK
jgi:hypothetical protein